MNTRNHIRGEEMKRQKNIIEQVADITIPSSMNLKSGQLKEIAEYAKGSEYGEKLSMMEIAFKYGYLQGMKSAGKKA